MAGCRSAIDQFCWIALPESPGFVAVSEARVCGANAPAIPHEVCATLDGLYRAAASFDRLRMHFAHFRQTVSN